jgi:SAM-dependent methyltransferase
MNIKKNILDVYKRELFRPTCFGVIINPLFIIRNGLHKGILLNKKYLCGKLMDFGCGDKPYKEVIDVDEYICLDIEASGHSHDDEEIDVYYDGKKIPFNDNYFDSILSTEVLEHVFNLDEIISELHRVLRPGGYMLLTLPFVWEEHEIPCDFARYTSFAIEHILGKVGFKVVSNYKTTNYVETIFQMWIAYVVKTILPSNRLIKSLLIPLCIAPITIVALIMSKVLPKNMDFYHNNIIVVQKMK